MAGQTYSKDEVVMLKRGRELSDLIAHPGWKIYQEIVEAQIATRHSILFNPGHDFILVSGGAVDGVTRYGALEHIKGVYNGLRLALETPQTIVREANELRDRASPTEGDE